MRDETAEPPNSNASSRKNRVTLPPPGLFHLEARSLQRGTMSTFKENHAESGWLCELVTGVDDTSVRENEFVEFLWIQEQQSMFVGLETSHTLR